MAKSVFESKGHKETAKTRLNKRAVKVLGASGANISCGACQKLYLGYDHNKLGLPHTHDESGCLC